MRTGEPLANQDCWKADIVLPFDFLILLIY